MNEGTETSRGRATSYRSWLKSIDPDRPHLERLIVLSDGVFAIALTLLALEVRAPENWSGDLRGLTAAMVIPMAAYFVSFTILAATWAQHRRVFAMLVKIDGPATTINLFLLSLAGLIPAAVNFEIKYSKDIAALYIYAGVVLAMNMAHLIFWIYVAILNNFTKPNVNSSYRVWYAVLWLFAIVGAVLQVLACRITFDVNGRTVISFERNLISLALCAVAVAAFARWKRGRAYLSGARSK